MRKSYPCRQCGARYQSLHALQRHQVRECSQLRFHFCRSCGKAFVPTSKRLQYCSRLCQRGIMPQHKQDTLPSHPQETSRALPALPRGYRKAVEFFAQRMPYTFHGMTWWATPCCYCGDPAEADEHVFPQAAFKKLGEMACKLIPDDLLQIVPACHECNGLAGDKVFQSFEEKRLYIKSRIGQRYHEALSFPHWDTEDLDALHGALRQWIATGQGVRDLVFERLRF
jgi:hypothetical protein